MVCRKTVSYTHLDVYKRQIEDHYGIVFVKHDRRPRKTRPSPILAVREVILLS